MLLLVFQWDVADTVTQSTKLVRKKLEFNQQSIAISQFSRDYLYQLQLMVLKDLPYVL